MSAVRRVVDVVGRPIDSLVRRRMHSSSFVVLIYHRVGRRSPSPVDLPTRVFAEQLDLLVERANVIDLDTAIGRSGDPAAARSPQSAETTAGTGREGPHVVLTFDDGTADWLDVVLPELQSRGLPATFYVSTDFVERGRPFPDDGRAIGWSALREMQASGVATIGSHTHTHRVLAGASEAVAADEIDRSVGLIGERLGVGCDHFAYPKAIAPSPAAEVVVRRRFASAVLAGNRANVAGRADPYRLGRHGLTVADDADSFLAKVGGGAWLEGRLRETRDRALAQPSFS